MVKALGFDPEIVGSNPAAPVNKRKEIMKRIILTLSNEEHAKVKAHAALVELDIQKVGITAFNEYFEKQEIDIKLSDQVKKT